MNRCTILIGAGVIALSLVACGGASEKGEDASAKASSQETTQAPTSNPLVGDARSTFAKSDDNAGGETGGDASSESTSADDADGGGGETKTIPMADATPDEAMQTYMNRLIAGDYQGALEVCDPDAAGTESFRKFAQNLENVRNDPEGGEGLMQIVVDKFTSGLMSLTWEMDSVTDDEAVFSLSSPTSEKAAQKIKVRLIDGHWRVAPPKNESGMPQA